MVMNASIDTGVEMLLAMPDEDAAKILVGCPSHVGRELLQEFGIKTKSGRGHCANAAAR